MCNWSNELMSQYKAKAANQSGGNRRVYCILNFLGDFWKRSTIVLRTVLNTDYAFYIHNNSINPWKIILPFEYCFCYLGRCQLPSRTVRTSAVAVIAYSTPAKKPITRKPNQSVAMSLCLPSIPARAAYAAGFASYSLSIKQGLSTNFASEKFINFTDTPPTQNQTFNRENPWK